MVRLKDYVEDRVSYGGPMSYIHTSNVRCKTSALLSPLAWAKFGF